MNLKLPIFLTFGILALCMAGCDHDGDSLPKPAKGTLIDYGYIPQEVDIDGGASFQPALIYNNAVYVATSNGLWKNDLSTKTWSQVGFDGKRLVSIYKHPELTQTFFVGFDTGNDASEKTLYVSNDGCQTWSAVATPIYDNLDNQYEAYCCFAARSGYPSQLFANLGGGGMMAVSKDGGQTWNRANYANESYMGYPCAIAFLGNDANHIYQAGEAPLDVAWLAKTEIDGTDPVLLNNRVELFGIDQWQNRRCNKLVSFSHVPNTFYVGQEGALSKVTGNTFKFIFKVSMSDGEKGDDLPYSYIKGIWVDRNNPKHLLFGGPTQLPMNDMRLYETYDEGKTIGHFSDPMGMTNPFVVDILETGTYPLLVICDSDERKVRLMEYRFNQ